MDKQRNTMISDRGPVDGRDMRVRFAIGVFTCARSRLLRDQFNNGTFAGSADSFCRSAMKALTVAKMTGDMVSETEFWRCHC